MKRIFLIHGWGGSPEKGWIPWLKRELEVKGFEVFALAMPDAEHPKMDAWLKQLRAAVGTLNKDCYFVGHSLGCITILRYLEGLKEDQQAGGVVLVAGFTDMDITVGEDEDVQELKSFFQTDVDFEEIKEHCKKFFAIHSDNDRYVDLRYANIFKEKLGAKIVIEQGKGHFSGEEGAQELPSALENVLQLIEE